jgi:hypothetical protein
MGLGGETKGRRGAVTFLVLGEEKQFQPGRGERLKRKEEGLCREGQAMGRLRWVGGGCLGSDGFRFRVCFVSLFFQNCPHLECVEGTSIYRQKCC